MEKRIILTKEQAEEIADILDKITEKKCCAKEFGEDNCLHCRALAILKFEVGWGKESDDELDDELLMEPGC